MTFFYRWICWIRGIRGIRVTRGIRGTEIIVINEFTKKNLGYQGGLSGFVRLIRVVNAF